MADTNLMPYLFPLIVSLYMFLYLSFNLVITSGIKRYWGEGGAKKWSNFFFILYSITFGLSVIILMISRQFQLDNAFDLIAIVCIVLNVTLLLKNWIKKEKWSSTVLFEGRDWMNAFTVNIPFIYLFVYTPVKLFFLGV